MDIRLKCHRSSHHRCSAKKLFLKILQYSQENTCFFNKVAGLHNFLDTYYKITVIRKLTNGSLWNHEHKSMQIMYVFINQFLQQATWLKGRNSMCIFAVGQALVPTQEEKTICALVERIYDYSLKGRESCPIYSVKSLNLSMWWDVSPPSSLFMGMQRKA